MNLRVTIGFVVVLVVLAVAVFGLDKFNVGPTQASFSAATSTASAAAQVQIFQFDDSRVTAMELHQGDSVARAEKQGDNWVVAQGNGQGQPANRSSFTSLIVRMSQLKSTRQVDNPSDLSQYGLDSPKDRAIAELDDGTKYELHLGTKTPVQTGTYAKRADTADVFVIADQFQTDLERLVTDPTEPPTPTPRPATPIPAVSPGPADTTATPAA
ncbi:MAG: DUF4340 domain-containing protein [Chloroflexi bacterium]|nr:DUF4340 domain-containing protein [Chloroflexota bacterium]